MNATPYILFPSVARAASTYYSDPINLEHAEEAVVFAEVTAVSGTVHTLDLTIQSKDNDGAWQDRVAFTQMTAAAKAKKEMRCFAQPTRLKAVVGGDGTVTFRASAIAKEGARIHIARFTPVTRAEATESGESAEFDLGDVREALLTLNVTAATGTLDAKVQTKDAHGSWHDLVTFSQATSVSKQHREIVNFGKTLKVVYTIGGGTPSFDFSVSVRAKS